MLLRRGSQDPAPWYGAGGLFLVAAIVIDRFRPPIEGFWSALLAGMSAAFIGASIVLNIRGVILQRRRSG